MTDDPLDLKPGQRWVVYPNVGKPYTVEIEEVGERKVRVAGPFGPTGATRSRTLWRDELLDWHMAGDLRPKPGYCP